MVLLDAELPYDYGRTFLKYLFKNIIVKAARLVYPNFKFVILLWLTNFAFAVALSLPIYSLLQDNLGRSVLGDRLYLQFDFLWLIQFEKIYEKSLSAVPFTLFSVAGIYIFIQLFYLGGLLSVFTNTKKNHMVDFFYGGVKYFYRFVKIGIISFILYFLALNVDSLLNYFIKESFSNYPSSYYEFLLQFIRYLLFLLWLGIISIISDYSKIATVVKDQDKIYKSIIYAILFIKDNFSKVLALFLILFIFLVLGGIIYNLSEGYIPRTPFYFIILTFILQQILIIFRVLIRMLVYSSEINLYTELSAEVIYSKAEEIKAGN